MNKSTFAKVFGWVQFGVQALGQVISTGQVPHGVEQWIALGASLATAVAVHQASGTDGSR